MPDEPRTLSYHGGPWAGATVTIAASRVVERREVGGGAYVLDGDTYTWTPTPAEPEQPAEDEEHTRPADTELQVRPAEDKPAAKTRPAPRRRTSTKP